MLGYLWSLLRPLMLFAVLLFVFTKIVRLGSGVPHYPVLLLMNVVLFGFFQESTTTSVTSVVTQEGVVRKTQFPRLVIPLSVVLTALFNLGLNLIVVLDLHPRLRRHADVDVAALPGDPRAALRLRPPACRMLLSSLYVRFRDMAIIWSVLAAVLFYATPILYPIEAVPSTYRELIMLNPLSPIFVQARKWIIDPSAPGPAAAAGGWTRPDRADRALLRDLRPRRLVLQPRGAADRRGALGAPAGLLDEGVP